MTLYSIIKYIFKDRTLYITGGFGETFNERIIIHRSIDNDYIGDEYKILEYITAIKKGYAYSMIQQSLKHIENCTLDILEVDFYIKAEDGEERVERALIHFDITKCFGKE